MKKSFKLKKVSGTIILLIIGVSFLLYAFSTGTTGKTLKNGAGCDCHGTSSGDVNVVIAGPDTLEPGQQANYTVTISGGPLVRGGTNIAASNGTLAIVSSDLRLENSELTHVSPKAPVSNSVTFEFSYTAPTEPGSETLFANGNSVNFNGNNLGDQWNFAQNKIIEIVSVTEVDDPFKSVSYNLMQNYPNPFNPSTTISFTLPAAGYAEVKIYNSAGEEIKTLVSDYLGSGNHSVDFNASSLASGVYYYKLITGNFVSVKKMILVK
jgi:hypothetical protein